MKKLFATLLAATMVAGTAVSAFAFVNLDENKEAAKKIGAAASTDDYTLSKNLFDKDGSPITGNKLKSGDKVYYPILVSGPELDKAGTSAYNLATAASEVDGLKVTLKAVRGNKYIKGASIVRKDLKLVADGTPAAKGTFTAALDANVTAANATGTYKSANGDVKVTVKKDTTNVWFVIGSDASNKVAIATATSTDFTIGTGADQVTLTVANPSTFMTTDGTQVTIGSVTGITAAGAGSAIGKAYCVEVALGDYFGTKETEVEYDLALKTRSTQYETKDLAGPKTSFDLGNDADVLTVGVDNIVKKFRNNELTLKIDKNTRAVKLDEAKENNGASAKDVEKIFLEGDKFDYEVKASGQGELYLELNSDSNKKVIVANQEAKMTFFNFPGKPEFDFTGVAKFTVEDSDKQYFFYEVVDGKPVKTSAKYDKEDECFELRTRTLGSYVISDKQLEVSDKKPATPTEKPADKPAEKPATPAKPVAPVAPVAPGKNVPTGAIA